jgi:IS5 family transposase
MRETRNAQTSIFQFYAPHALGDQLSMLSDLLDDHPLILDCVERDFRVPTTAATGASGLSVESVFRCLLLKQILKVSYEKLSFHLSDSPTYRTFARLHEDQFPSRSGLQSTIRHICPGTLEQANQILMSRLFEDNTLSLDWLRIDSTVTDSNIAKPSDSQLLNDGVRVLSRLMSQSKDVTSVKIRFTDQRKKSKSLSYRIFHAKKAEKNALYPKLLSYATLVLKQSRSAIVKVRLNAKKSENAERWIGKVEHFRALLPIVVDQTQRRVYNDEDVPASQKIVSLFEPHTDIIVKGLRDVQFGHKINLATQQDGFITYCRIEEGNPADAVLYMPVLNASQTDYQTVPNSAVADGCYASQANVKSAKALGVKRNVFSKMVGLTLTDMGVKKKTFELLRNFRAGVEGNISEFKRAFGASKATWKGHDGFKAFVWSSVLSYNLIRVVRFSSA